MGVAIFVLGLFIVRLDEVGQNASRYGKCFKVAMNTRLQAESVCHWVGVTVLAACRQRRAVEAGSSKAGASRSWAVSSEHCDSRARASVDSHCIDLWTTPVPGKTSEVRGTRPRLSAEVDLNKCSDR